MLQKQPLLVTAEAPQSTCVKGKAETVTNASQPSTLLQMMQRGHVRVPKMSHFATPEAGITSHIVGFSGIVACRNAILVLHQTPSTDIAGRSGAVPPGSIAEVDLHVSNAAKAFFW